MKFIKDIHSVNRFKILVDYPEVTSAKETQGLVTVTAKHKLAQSLESLFEMYGNNFLTRIGKLELDLGDISIENLENEVVEKFEKQIAGILTRINNNVLQHEGMEDVEIVDEKRQLLDYFVHYLKYGTLPWYMQSILRVHSFNEILQYLIDENDINFQETFFQLSKDTTSRRRLVRFIDSGEVIEFFQKNLSTGLYQSIFLFYSEINQLISAVRGFRRYEVEHLLLYVKEFLLDFASRADKSSYQLALEEITRKYIDFIYRYKKIGPLKWLPGVIKEHAGKIESNTHKSVILQAIQKQYVNYLLESGFTELQFDEKTAVSQVTDKNQAYQWLRKSQPEIAVSIRKAVETLVLHLEKSFQSVGKAKLERVIWSIAIEVLPVEKIPARDIEKWINAVYVRVEKTLGVSLEKQIFKKQLSVEQLSDTFVADLSVVTAYWKLFLEGGLAPFARLYQNPAAELKQVFLKSMNEAPQESRKIIRENLNKNNIIALWWVKETFGEDFYMRFLHFVDEEIKADLPDDITFSNFLLVSLLRTGNFPWAELQDKGYHQLIQKIAEFTESSKRDKFIELLVYEEFFEKKHIMKKVFDIMPLSFNKELLKIQTRLADDGIISSSADKTEDDEKEKSDDKLKKTESIYEVRFVDELASKILKFVRHNYPLNYTQEEYARHIFEQIKISAEKNLYETAAMLANFDKTTIDPLWNLLNNKQKEYMRKILRTYRTKFMSLSADVSRSETTEGPKYREMHEETEEPVFIKNAGLVLLNPYIKRLFKHLGLLNDKDFASEKDREKAVYILQYIANKSEQPDEYELSLNKILTGIPLTAPLQYEVKITEEEKEVCDGLIDAIIKNWGALKNTSRDGLRTSFFLREGSLIKKATGWHLRVEKKTYDILLEKLPWGYSFIQMPWMEKPLTTEWEEQKT